MDIQNRVATCKRDKSFKLKPIKRKGKIPKQHLKSIPTMRNFKQMAQQFTTAPTSPNSYVTCTINNMALISTLTNEKKDWIKKYHRII